MYLKPKDVLCKYKDKTCFANVNGYCLALQEMPEKVKCPFYKPRYSEKERNGEPNIL